MHPLLNNPFSGGCAFASANPAFPPVAAALRLPVATLPGRSAGSCRRRRLSSARASSDGSDGAVADAVAAEASAVGQSKEGEEGAGAGPGGASAESSAEKQPPPVNPKIEKELKKAVQKTAATFAPRASTATKNPAVPGTVLYTVFEVQGYASMLMGGALSFNLVYPSNEPARAVAAGRAWPGAGRWRRGRRLKVSGGGRKAAAASGPGRGGGSWRGGGAGAGSRGSGARGNRDGRPRRRHGRKTRRAAKVAPSAVPARVPAAAA